ncbi:MAG: hypothetical protein OXI63_26110 [Candidatus Poribacteria bacterium]|nr:hypothetical protein [Candidatus Poribacteria bacterium]
MHTEWCNEPEMSEDERALERREYQYPILIISVAVLESIPSIEGGNTLLHTKFEDSYE